MSCPTLSFNKINISQKPSSLSDFLYNLPTILMRLGPAALETTFYKETEDTLLS